MLDVTRRREAEEAVRESEETARALLEAPTDTILLVDTHGMILDLNENAVNRFGRNREELVGSLLDTFLPVDLAKERRRKITEVLTTGKPLRFPDQNGDTWFDNVAYPIKDKDGNVARIAIIARDITDLKRAEVSLRESEEKYRNLVERSLQGLTVIQNGRPVFANTEMLEIGGYASMDEYLALSASDLMATIHPDDRVRIRKVMADRLAGKNIPAENEFRILRADGQVRWVLTRGALIEYNNAPAIQVTYFDITSRRKAEQALAESEERLRQIAETLTNGVFYMYDRVSNQFIYVSPAYEKIWGRSCRSLYDDPYTYLEAVHPEDKPRLWENIRHELEEGVYIDTEYRILQPGGTVRWIHSRNFPVSDPDGKVNRVAGMAEDITERRIAEDALRESEDRYRKLVEISPSAVLLHQDGKVIYANQALAGILGAGRPEDLIGKDVLDLVHPDYRATVRANISRDLAGEMSPFTELQLIRKDGAAVLVEGQGVGTTIGGRPSVLVSITDITESSRAEQALRESGERYRTLAEASQDLIFVIGRDDRVEYVNSYAAAAFGLSATQLIGRGRAGLFPGETGARQKAGLEQVFRTGRAVRSEGPLDLSGTSRWYDHFLMPVTDSENRVTSVLGISRDITDRKDMEQKLRANEERYRSLLEQTFDAVVIHKEGRIAFLNERAARILGAAAPEELIGRPILDLIHPDSCKDLQERLKIMAADPSRPVPVLQEKFFRVDGTIVSVDVMAVRIPDDGHPAAIRVFFRESPGQG
jgi:PAS domain S-box-containing protein